ncbi:MAG TPA: glycosyl transferase family protein [Allosphingosinicella sp.]
MDGGIGAVDFVLRETALFAAVGFLILGLSDLAVDLIWLVRAAGGRRGSPLYATDIAVPFTPGPVAVFIPAWEEARVIARMLRHALAAYGSGDIRLYVGCYPNDPETIAAVRSVADPRLRLVLGPAPGPTTKADCLNRIWEAMRADERQGGRRFRAVLLHDAEDVVHSAELPLCAALVERFDLVQLPVIPLIDPGSRWIAGHYADEFAEAHAKALVVREAIGAALPSAGVGCAIARGALDRLAARHGLPFDGDSLTEDYELGLRLRDVGGRAAFVRVRAAPGCAVVATREYFPATLAAAVAQKARWMRGIALSGWDRLGWSGGLAERWMRMRDRQSLLAAILLLAGYTAFLLWTARTAGTLAGLGPVAIGEPLRILLLANGGLLAWRLAMRFAFVTHAYGWREGLRALPRTIVGNLVAILAARQAVVDYAAARGAVWDKTDHAFPHEVPAE